MLRVGNQVASATQHGKGVNLLEFVIYLKNRFRREEGATMVEYGLMVAGIAMVVAVAAFALGGGISTLFGAAEDCVATPAFC